MLFKAEFKMCVDKLFSPVLLSSALHLLTSNSGKTLLFVRWRIKLGGLTDFTAVTDICAESNMYSRKRT